METNETRLYKLRTYLFGILDDILSSSDYSINANFLDNDIENYSLDKLPIEPVTETWIIGPEVKRDVFTFRSRKAYSQDIMNNLSNIGFFETFENKIKENNDNGNLPDIDGIVSIKCLNCGTLNMANTKEAEFDIQIEIKYIKN